MRRVVLVAGPDGERRRRPPVRPPSGAVVAVAVVPGGVGAAGLLAGATPDEVVVDREDPGPYSVRFPLPSDGAREVQLAAVGDAGRGAGSVPFTVVTPPTPALE